LFEVGELKEDGDCSGDTVNDRVKLAREVLEAVEVGTLGLERWVEEWQK